MLEVYLNQDKYGLLARRFCNDNAALRQEWKEELLRWSNNVREFAFRSAYVPLDHKEKKE